MKIAIPTDDGLFVSGNLNPDSTFLVITLELGEIIGQEMRSRKPGNTFNMKSKPFQRINDCDVVIANEVGTGTAGVLVSLDKILVRTNETIVTSALMQYLDSAFKKESNTCCCP